MLYSNYGHIGRRGPKPFDLATTNMYILFKQYSHFYYSYALEYLSLWRHIYALKEYLCVGEVLFKGKQESGGNHSAKQEVTPETPNLTNAQYKGNKRTKKNERTEPKYNHEWKEWEVPACFQ